MFVDIRKKAHFDQDSNGLQIYARFPTLLQRVELDIRIWIVLQARICLLNKYKNLYYIVGYVNRYDVMYYLHPLSN
jgi:hypothetical protein